MSNFDKVDRYTLEVQAQRIKKASLEALLKQYKVSAVLIQKHRATLNSINQKIQGLKIPLQKLLDGMTAGVIDLEKNESRYSKNAVTRFKATHVALEPKIKRALEGIKMLEHNSKILAVEIQQQMDAQEKIMAEIKALQEKTKSSMPVHILLDAKMHTILSPHKGPDLEAITAHN